MRESPQLIYDPLELPFFSNLTADFVADFWLIFAADFPANLAEISAGFCGGFSVDFVYGLKASEK